MCSTYSRILKLEEELATSVCERFHEDRVVVPPCLHKGIFTVAAIDNIDYNPSSATAKSSFHGTGISLFQFPDETAVFRPGICIPPTSNRRELLQSYSNVPCVEFSTSNVTVPLRGQTGQSKDILSELQREEEWLGYSVELLSKQELTQNDKIAWAAFHASKQPSNSSQSSLHALLPLFYEKAATLAMMKHGMDVIDQAIQFLHPGQVPVMACDQPLFALSKFVQWKYPETHGEDKFVVMLGGLHTEMALWSVLGDLLDGIGWVSILTEADVATSGVAQSFLKASHLLRTRNAHQITVLALFRLQHEAFQTAHGEQTDMFQEWKETMLKNSPTFFFWELILRLECQILMLVRAHREKNFDLYISMLENLTPLFFALDHVNYARWMPIHIRDMCSLPPSVLQHFRNDGHWVVSKTPRRFSSIPIDQAHEQENKVVKGSGGAKGLTENPSAFQRWMVAGPEMARRLKEFEVSFFTEDQEEAFHHQEGLATQKTFQKHVNSFCETVTSIGNPFQDDCEELVTFDSRNCLDESVASSVRQIEAQGKKQYQEYVSNVLVNQTAKIQDTIKRNSFPLPKNPQRKTKPKQGKKIKLLQNNVALFGQLVLADQYREADLDEFFSHETQAFPPSLSEFGNLYLPSTKSQLLDSIINSDATSADLTVTLEAPNNFDCKILDGPAVVHFLSTAGAITFENYAKNAFIPYLEQQLQTCSRLDIVWDRYFEHSLKESTREHRGKGLRRKVEGHLKLPGNWMNFLRESSNKRDLFDFLSLRVESHQFPTNKSVYITKKEYVLTSSSNKMPKCTHEEADTRIMVHLIHALEGGKQLIQVRTVDTDVIVILIGNFHDLKQRFSLQDVWVFFGTGKHIQLLSIKKLCS
jgi:hypothetical protein